MAFEMSQYFKTTKQSFKAKISGEGRITSLAKMAHKALLKNYTVFLASTIFVKPSWVKSWLPWHREIEMTPKYKIQDR